MKHSPVHIHLVFSSSSQVILPLGRSTAAMTTTGLKREVLELKLGRVSVCTDLFIVYSSGKAIFFSLFVYNVPLPLGVREGGKMV